MLLHVVDKIAYLEAALLISYSETCEVVLAVFRLKESELRLKLVKGGAVFCSV